MTWLSLFDKKRNMDFETYAKLKSMEGEVASSRAEVMKRYLSGDQAILDVGCGDGRHLEFLCKFIPRAQLCGTEVSLTRAYRVKRKGYNCVLVDSCHLPFCHDSFDAIIFFEVIEHVSATDVKLLLSEFKRVLKSEGIVIGSTPNYPIKRIYMFFLRLRIRIRQLLYILKKRGSPSMQNSRFDRLRVKQYSVTNGRMSKPSLMARLATALKKLSADDPTHVSHYSHSKLHSLFGDRFTDEMYFSTLSGILKPISLGSWCRHFSHKIIFVLKP